MSNQGATAETEPQAAAAAHRIESIDALRGFDMFWIVGADVLAGSLRGVSDSRAAVFFADQLEHVPWEGLRFYDLIFPLFVFLMGVSTVFSLSKTLERGGRRAAYGRVVRRAAVLYALGLIYYGGLSRDGGPEEFRYVGVLQRIALCYLFGGLLLLHLRLRGLLVVCAVLLVGYWAAMTFVPVPGHGAGVFEEGKNLADYVDQHYLPGYKWNGDWDPEGLLSTLPAIATGLLGVFAGLILQREEPPPVKKAGLLAAIGAGCLLVGYAWGLQFPIIKNLWTSSYVLVAGGYSYLLLAAFYLVIDVWKLRWWAQPFVWIGMNCITIYLMDKFVGGLPEFVRRAVHPPIEEAMAPYGEVVVAALALTLAVLICRGLYRRRIFLRV